VEFVLEDGISDEDAMKMIARDPPVAANRFKEPEGSANVMTMESTPSPQIDLFGGLLDQYEREGRQDDLKVGKDILISLKKTEVYVKRWPSPGLRNQYFKLLMPEIPVILCTSCNHFFHEEDFEIASITKSQCPICRCSIEKAE